MKIAFLSLILILCFSNDVLSKIFPQEIITNEAKYYNACYKEMKKKAVKAEKKADRESKEADKIGHKNINDNGPQIFKRYLGGVTIKFSFDDCIKNRRSKIENDFIEKLSTEEKAKFKERVKKEIKKKYPEIDEGYY